MADSRLFDSLVHLGILQVDTEPDIRTELLNQGTDVMSAMTGSPQAAVDGLLRGSYLCIALLKECYPEESTRQLAQRWDELANKNPPRFKTSMDRVNEAMQRKGRGK